jgi:class 3 adenylate cyclase
MPDRSSPAEISLDDKIQRQKKLSSAQFTALLDVYRHYRQGTFLSLDIVGSTRLKEGVDGMAVVDTFKAFHSYVGAFTTTAVSSVFSGDGVMCFFKTPQEAVDAALAILRNLEMFNQHKSRLKRYLNVRIGINTGMILYEEKKELGKYTERTIDIAGHFQKYGEPGQLLISQATREGLADRSEFKKRWWKIDKTVVYAYRKTFTPAVTAMPLMRVLPSWEKVSYKIRRFLFILFREWRYRMIGASLLALLAAGYYGNNVWNGSTLPRLDQDERMIKAWVMNNRVRFSKPWYHLGHAKIKQGEHWKYLPKTVYLVIPPGRNSYANIRLGLRENEVVPLRRAIDNKYRKAWWRTGLYLIYVETYNDYAIFTSRNEAENFVGRGRSR